MNPKTDLLDRAVELFPAPERSFDRLARRRDRKRRNQRVAAGVLAIAIAVAAIGGVLIAFHDASERRPADNPRTMAPLHEVWSVTGFGADTPVVADGVVFTPANGGVGEMRAYPASCANPCQPLWVASTGGGTELDQPAVADGMVFVAQGRWTPTVGRKLFAFPTDCSLSCEPTWFADIGGVANPSLSPAIADGVVYIVAADQELYAFSETCGTGGARCKPLWNTPIGDGAPASMAVGGGAIYVGTEVGRYPSGPGELRAFPTNCNAPCAPLWVEHFPDPVWDLAVVGDRLIVATSATVSAYPTDCWSRHTCHPLWIADVPSLDGNQVTIDGNTVYVDAERLGLIALPLDCGSGGATCQPRWTASGFFVPQTTISYGRPVVASGIVYVGSTDGRLFGFPTTCADPCEPLWTYRVVDTRDAFVWIAAGSGQIYAGTDGGDDAIQGIHALRLGT